MQINKLNEIIKDDIDLYKKMLMAICHNKKISVSSVHLISLMSYTKFSLEIFINSYINTTDVFLFNKLLAYDIFEVHSHFCM